MKPFIYKTFFKYRHRFYIIPSIELWYNKNEFLETGIYSPALGLKFSWLKWGWEIIFQKGY